MVDLLWSHHQRSTHLSLPLVHPHTHTLLLLLLPTNHTPARSSGFIHSV
jgi:hypothetical protein